MKRNIDHFKRAKQMFAALARIAQLPIALRAMLMGGLEAYRSRGKGRAGHQKSRHTVAQDKRNATRARNRRRNKRS